MSAPERDRSVERLLSEMRQTRGVDAAAAEACLDAGDLAAWADGALPPSRATGVESHLSTCARCQGILAAFVKSELAPAPRPFWSRWQIVVPMLVSSAAAATFAFALWPRRTVPIAPSATVAQTEPAPVTVPTLVPAPPAVAVQPQPPTQPGADAETAAVAPRAQASSTSTRLAPAAARIEGKPTEPAPSRPSASDQPKTSTSGGFTTDQMLKVPSARDPWQVVNMAPGVILSGANVGGSSSGQQVTVSAFGTSGNVQWNLEGGNISETAVVATFGVSGPVAPSPLTRVAAGRGGGRGGGVSAVAAPQTEAADQAQPPSVRWRILADGHVDRSTDNGASWMRMSTDPALFITAGAAASPTTCWLGGRAGVVMVTGDNEHFTRADLPARVDAKSVTVVANLVTVVTATGVSYSSVDGGKTWQRRE